MRDLVLFLAGAGFAMGLLAGLALLQQLGTLARVKTPGIRVIGPGGSMLHEYTPKDPRYLACLAAIGQALDSERIKAMRAGGSR